MQIAYEKKERCSFFPTSLRGKRTTSSTPNRMWETINLVVS